jgi:DGQHR domain-containing protein
VGSKRKHNSLPKFFVIHGTCLGHEAYRGFGALRDIARISKADIFDQENNPSGTQRNLSVQHARKAYQYVTEKDRAFYPEMILNVRDPSYIKFTPADCSLEKGKRDGDFGVLSFVKDPEAASSIVVSRLDGNHRLWFARGDGKGLEPVARPASFCMVALDDLNAELELFRDINDNQMGMNTSHLQNITARLLGDKALKVQNPALYIVGRLQADRTSPLYHKIHEGGKVRKGATITGLTVANLTNAIRDMLSRSAKLSQFPDAEAQYKIIKNYWSAVKKWLPDAWKRPRDFMIFKGVGLYAISYVGIEVIDRSLLKSKFSSRDMLEFLKQLPSDQLSVRETLAYAGRGGGRKLANDLIQNLEEEGQISLSKLQKLILKEE